MDNSGYNSIYDPIQLLCGHLAYFDDGSGCAHRCGNCDAVVGSIAMPRHCKELYDMERVVEKLKGQKK